MNSAKLIILGHINPDVDSIISGLLLEYYINNNTSYKAEFVIPDQLAFIELKLAVSTYVAKIANFNNSLLKNSSLPSTISRAVELIFSLT